MMTNRYRFSKGTVKIFLKLGSDDGCTALYVYPKNPTKLYTLKE